MRKIVIAGIAASLMSPLIIAAPIFLATSIQQATDLSCTTGTQAAPVSVTLTSAQLQASQIHYAELIIGVAKGRGLNVRDAAVGVATGMQESSLSNPLTPDPHGSLGLFQQTPADGWGTYAQVTDPVYAANAFFNALVKLPNINDPSVSVTVLAQDVQHSAYPSAYEKWATVATQLADQGYGQKAGTGIVLAAANGCSLPSAAVGPYKNPLRSVQGLRPERVDQGVDYAGSGSVYALGDGVITNLTNSGWNYGGYDAFIVEHLTDGPAKGKYAYVAEGCIPQSSLSVPETVTAQTVLCQMIPGSTGIETGWANSTGGSPESQMVEAGSISGASACIQVSIPTQIGLNYNQMLVAMGAPSGTTNPGTCGLLPAGWPPWK